MREWVSTQSNKCFFDIADIEAWSPQNMHQTFTIKDIPYEMLYTGYSYDGVHLNKEGRQRMAIGLYSLLGKMLAFR